MSRIITILGAVLLCFTNCSDNKNTLFTALSEGETGIKFRNLLEESPDLNVLNYQYFYNGSGVATGDINNDGLVDICFVGNMVKNRLYLNKGNFEFEDITQKATIADKQGWCTGVTMVDINNDGWLDIYICRSADGNVEKRKNLLFINNKDLSFTEKAAEYGLDDSGYSTQASFFDMDKDGDLDMFLLNHSSNEFSGFKREMITLKQTKNSNFGSKLYRNDAIPPSGGQKGGFTDITEGAGITSNVLSFGLGVAVFDANNDSWLDIYVSNDFNEEDYLFVNQKNGTFKESVREAFDYVSLFSMGSDAADINNDGKIDLMTLDMLPEDNFTQKMHSGSENYDKVQLLFQSGFHYQFSRNMLHLNNGNGRFSEIGQLAGVANTDWSWTALFADYDLDGHKDLYVTNGYVKDYTNMDFLKFYAESSQENPNSSDPNVLTKKVLDKMPSSKTENYAYKNNGDLTFSKQTKAWGLGGEGFSSGAAYADLDNDGDLDLVVNKINEFAAVFRNNAETLNQHNYLKINLKGTNSNLDAIGTTVTVYAKGTAQTQQLMPSRGYASSVDKTLVFGLEKQPQVDSVVVRWYDDKKQVLTQIKTNQTLKIEKNTEGGIFAEKMARPIFNPNSTILNYTHQENAFQDFKTQPLLPHFLSRCGPRMAKGDVNNDGLEDLYVCGAKGFSGSLFLQNGKGNFSQKNTPAFDLDRNSEDADATFFDADGDKDLDLYVVSGGYEFADNDPNLQDRLYINDGKGNFSKKTNAIPTETTSGACAKTADVDGDGDLDVFVGGYVVPSKYPMPPLSILLVNDGKGNFLDKTATIAPEIKQIGLVRDAIWADVNKDNQADLVVCGEWLPMTVFINQKGILKPDATWTVKNSSGWWQKMVAEDFDNDGDVDLMAGNWGTNSQIKVSADKPATLCYKDFAGNGAVNPIMSYYIGDKSYPSPSRDDLLEQLVFLKKKFTNYQSYANATLTDVFTKEELTGSQTLTAEQLHTCYFENTGNGFKMTPLSIEAQFSPIYDFAVLDVNKDGRKDVITVGNNATTRIKYGQYAANHGQMFINEGQGKFRFLPESGLSLRGDVRSAVALKSGKVLFGINAKGILSYELN